MVKITRRSVGAWGPARKCCGSEAPRKVHLHCAYKPAELRHAAERARNRALRIARDALSSGDPCLSFAEQPGSDSELEDNEEGQPCDDAETLAVIRGHHAKYSASVVPEGVSRELLKEFNKLEKAKQWFSLPEDVRQAINGEANAFVLFRYCHTGGQEAFSLHLKRDVREDEAIFAYTGKLYTKEAWEVKHPKPTDKTHLWAYDVPASEYGDGSGPDLVVAADEQRNESCYVQDFSWFSKTFPAEHNLYTKVYWTTTRAHPKQVLPYIVYCAEGNLCAGTELDVSWGDMCWQALSQHEVMKQAEFSWLESYRLLHLKAHVQAAKGSLPGPSNAPAAATSGGGSCGGSNGGGGGGKAAAGAGAVITFDRGLGYIESIVEAEEERNAAGAAAAHSRKRAKLPPPGVCYRRIGGKSASLLPLFPGFSTAVDDSALPASLRKAMDKCPKRKGVRVATEEEEELIASGELPGCVVAEVRGLHHSVRWATPPSHKAYTVLKATGPTINEGDPIGIYGGEMRVGSDTVDDPADEAYAMELPYKDLRQISRDVAWPSDGLVVDAGSKGNVARFINDVWGQNEDRSPNVKAEVIWSCNRRWPYVMLYALEAIEKDDELLLHYGDNYWRYHAQHLQVLQFQYHMEVKAQINELEAWVREHQGEQELQRVLEAGRVDLAAKTVYDE